MFVGAIAALKLGRRMPCVESSMIEKSEANVMNQRLVESVAQTILAMSAEERQLLESTLQRLIGSSQMDEPAKEVKSLSVAEIAQDIQTFEKTYGADQFTNSQNFHPQNGESVTEFVATEPTTEPTEDSTLKNPFLRMAQSLKLEGPADFSVNIDHYLYGLPKQDV